MRKKCYIFALCSFLLALAIYVFSYYLYHYASPDGGFTSVYQLEAAKPMVTWLFAIWGVTLQGAAVVSLLAGWIFFPKEKGKKSHG